MFTKPGRAGRDEFTSALFRSDFADMWFLYMSGMQTARFKICQQKYLELLEEQSVNEALHVLRNELAPLSSDDEELHSLSG